MSEQPRTPFTELRPWSDTPDEQAREQARGRLEAHIAANSPVGPRRLRWPRPGRRLSLLLATAALAGGGSALAVSLLHTQHTGHLPIFTSHGRLSSRFHVGARGTGHCWTASLATAENNAYRCIEGNAIHDPCFAFRPSSKTVACFMDPWHPVTLLKLDRPLPPHPHEPPGLPWAIELTDGRRCVFLTGATAPMGGQRINYGCVGGSFLIGDPDTAPSLWTIHSARSYRPEAPGHSRPLSAFPAVGIKLTVP